VRAGDPARRRPVAARQGHVEIAREINARLEIQRLRGLCQKVVCELLAGPVRLAAHARTVRGFAAQRVEELDRERHCGVD
jgi:hypothetical protein